MVVDTFNTTGSVLPLKLSGRPRSTRTAATEAAVIDTMSGRRLSIRNDSRQLHVGKSAVQRIL